MVRQSSNLSPPVAGWGISRALLESKLSDMYGRNKKTLHPETLNSKLVDTSDAINSPKRDDRKRIVVLITDLGLIKQIWLSGLNPDSHICL